MKKKVVLIIVGISAMILLQGCATNRGILDVQAPQVAEPAGGKAITIIRVTDKRVFEVRPKNPSTPSIKGGRIEDKAIISRAIARKRNSYGKALGDILLPEGRTVEDVVREALTAAFRDAGYRVVEGTAGKEAIPVEADIEQFWAWTNPGFWAITLSFEARVIIKGNVGPFTAGETVRGFIELHGMIAAEWNWRNTINKGIQDFVNEVKKRLATTGKLKVQSIGS